MDYAAKSPLRVTKSSAKLRPSCRVCSQSFSPARQRAGCSQAIPESRGHWVRLDTRILGHGLGWHIRQKVTAVSRTSSLDLLGTAAFGQATDFSTPLLRTLPASTK